MNFRVQMNGSRLLPLLKALLLIVVESSKPEGQFKENTQDQEEEESPLEQAAQVQSCESQSLDKSLTENIRLEEKEISSTTHSAPSIEIESDDIPVCSGEDNIFTDSSVVETDLLGASESKTCKAVSDEVREDKSSEVNTHQSPEPELGSGDNELDNVEKVSCPSEPVKISTDTASADLASSVKSELPAESVEPEPDTAEEPGGVADEEEQSESDSVAALEEPVKKEKSVSQLFDKLSKSAETKHAGDKQVVRDSKEEDVLNRLSKAGEQKSSGWGSWGSWGSTLLSTATSSINTFTGQVSEGMHTVVDTFEASVGAPPASELASEISEHVKEPDEQEVIPKSTAQQSHNQDDQQSDEVKAAQIKAEEGSDWFAGWGVSGITNQLQSKTKVLVESGLDVLETIGKKTMEQIKETDPGYVKTKGLLRGGSNSLSQALREAKLNSEKATAEEPSASALINYSTLFDEHKGLLSLEALELLSITATERVGAVEDVSDTCQARLSSLSDTFNAIHYSEEDSSEDSYDFAENIDDVVEQIGLPIKLERITKVEQKTRAWLDDCLQRQDAGERIDGVDIHKAAIDAFAELTSCAMEIYHKSGVLLSHDLLGDNQVDTESVSSCFVSILKLVSKEITILSLKFNDCLNTAADDSECPDSINPMITDVFLEASNSTSYVRDAFKLLLPIVQRFELSTEKSPTHTEK
ncbi:protein FAM114A2-like isoform X2 [Watersipora subatra]|uniref:protein FAM114A2-like isoform X2 n=1 Tax=Watersipora subatra TaxID=2589382 RepID=UPI00355B4509